MSCLKQKPGKEGRVAEFLKGGLPVVEAEPATIAWSRLRLGPSTLSIFSDAFPMMPAGKRIWPGKWPRMG